MSVLCDVLFLHSVRLLPSSVAAYTGKNDELLRLSDSRIFIVIIPINKKSRPLRSGVLP